MSPARWRALCFGLAAACVVLLWRDCGRSSDPRPAADCPRPVPVARGERAASAEPAEPTDREARAPAEPAEPGEIGPTLYGIELPPWLVWIAPHPGEDLREYRDRMLPLAVAAIAPQRARVARSLDSFAALAHLDPGQRTALDTATRDTAAALQDRVLAAVLDGELAPATFKPMAGVGVARALLDIVERGNRRFLEALREDQRAALAQHPFDFGDYLVFSTRWEDALRLL
ncbi:MAG TPA: hypothetical protein VHT91_40990 [Kofleriaceae bacterium]|jgi:hypothetical protein|nr:hypothetical protein [Kofleriaceae bacterium]